MSDLTHISQTIKKIGPPIIIFLIIVILIGITIFRLTRKSETRLGPISPPLITQNPEQKQPRNFDFSAARIEEIPKTLPVYSIAPYNITETAAITLASSLGFQGNPTSTKDSASNGEEFNWSVSDRSLTVGQTNLEYRNKEYRKRLSLPFEALSQEELKNEAVSFMGKITLLGQDIELKNTKYQIILGNDRAPVANFEDAQIVEFSFDKKVANIPLIDNYPGSGFTKLRVFKDGQVIYLFSQFFEKFSESGFYKLKTADESIEEIRRGQGKVVRAQVLSDKGVPKNIYEHPENIDNAKIEKVSLAYFLPNDLKEAVQPIFVFEGGFKTDQNENGEVVIYLPAIKQNK